MLLNAGEPAVASAITSRQERIKNTTRVLKDGLQEWILVNKERQQKLQTSVQQCDHIRENESNTFQRFQDVTRIQKLTKESLEKTSVLLAQQTQTLSGLDQTVDQIKSRLDDNLAAGPYRPPNTILYIALVFVVIAGFFLGTPYLLEYYDVKGEDLGVQSTRTYLRNYMYSHQAKRGSTSGHTAVMAETAGGVSQSQGGQAVESRRQVAPSAEFSTTEAAQSIADLQ